MKYFGIDCETYDPLLTDQGPSWAYGKGEILVTGLYDVAAKQKKSIDGDGGKTVNDLLFSSDSVLVGANIGYDLGWLCYSRNLRSRALKCNIIDISIAEALIDEYQPYSLDALAQKYLKERKGHEKLADVVAGYGWKGDFRKYLKELWYGETPDQRSYQPEIRAYVISDADQPTRIWELQQPILEAQGLMSAFETNMRMVLVTLGMKQHGVRIDYAKWSENCGIAKSAYDKLWKDFKSKYGEVNFRSGKQMAALFDKEDVPYKYKIVIKGWEPTDRKFSSSDWFDGDEVWEQRKRLKESFPSIRVSKGKIVLMVPKQYAMRTAAQASDMGYAVSCNPSINKFTFAATKATHKVVADVVELKQVSNIIDKFLGPNFGRFLVPQPDGTYRLHGNFDPVGARQTLRLSASKPNLQNIPSKTKLFANTPEEINLAKMCREVFVPDIGHMWVKLDYSGQENVLQAEFAVGENGKLIRKMYNENPRLDEHQFVATRSGLEETHGKEAGRKYAKNVRFGLAYGMQLTTMCEQFGWGADFAEPLIEDVKAAAPWVPETMSAIQDMLLGQGKFRGKPRRYIKTISGRRIHLREGYDRDAYKFYNYLIQGSAADMMKAALVQWFDTQDADQYGDELVVTVHDEGDFSVPITREGIERVKAIQQIFQASVKLSVPINADPEAGANWARVESQVKGETTYFGEYVEDLLTRVGAKILSGKTDLLDKTEVPCDNDDTEIVDFDLLGEEDDEEMEE